MKYLKIKESPLSPYVFYPRAHTTVGRIYEIIDSHNAAGLTQLHRIQRDDRGRKVYIYIEHVERCYASLQ